MLRDAIIVSSAALALGCTTTPVCECQTAGIHLTEASLVTVLTVSGTACEDATIYSNYESADAPGGTEQVDHFVARSNSYYIRPKRAGDCTVHVALADGSVVDRTTPMKLEAGNDCCPGGVYAVHAADTFVDLSDIRTFDAGQQPEAAVEPRNAGADAPDASDG